MIPKRLCFSIFLCGLMFSGSCFAVSEKAYKNTVDQMKAGNYKTAQKLIKTIDFTLGYANYLDWIKLKLALATDDIPAAQSVLRGLQSTVDSEFMFKKGSLALAAYYLEKGELSSCEELLSRTLAMNEDIVLTPEAYKLKIQLLIKQRKIEEVLTTYGQLVTLSPDGDEGETVWKQIRQAFPIKLTLYDCFADSRSFSVYVRQLYENRQFNDAKEAGQYLLNEFPDLENRSEIHVIIGLSYYSMYALEKAVPYFTLVDTEAPKLSPERLESLYFLGRIYDRLGDKDRAHAYFLDIVEHFPISDTKAKALYYACGYLKLNGPFRKYKELVKEFERDYAQSGMYEKFLWESQWNEISFLTDRVNAKDVPPLLEKYLDKPFFRDKLIRFYKHDFSLESSKKQTSGRLSSGLKQLPVSYYAYQLINKLPEQGEVQPLRKTVSKDSLPFKYEKLVNMGLGDIALQEMKYQQSNSEKNKGDYLMSEVNLAYKNSEFSKAVKLIHRWVPYEQRQYGEVPVDFIPLYYPIVFWPTIKKYSKKYSVDPFLVLAVMREESHFDPSARSRTNAMGLMQIVPVTGKDIARRVGHRWRGSKKLLNPNLNIAYGTFYLSWLSKKFDGKIHYMLSGYNAGPGITGRWKREFGEQDALTFMSHIPYAETSDYVEKVMNSYLIYKMMYDGTDIDNIAFAN